LVAHSILRFDKVFKSFPGQTRGEIVPALNDLTFDVPKDEDGEILAILGPSGCGKSTILNLISGLLRQDSGDVLVNGSPVLMPNPDSVTVPQAYTCFPWLTVLGNVEFGLKIQGKSSEESRTIAREYLKKVGLADREDAYPRQLSGGMQQRVAIARTLAMQPRIVLMDEPFGALDPQTRADMQQMLLDLWSVEKNLVIFVTHDITEAAYLADRILILSNRPATVIHDMKVPFGRPRNADIKNDPEFNVLCHFILNLLKSNHTMGQVRVTL